MEEEKQTVWFCGERRGEYADTLALVRAALQDECGVDPSAVHEDTHLLKDLGVDSLDLLNAAFRIEQVCGVRLPAEKWLMEEYGDVASRHEPFLVKEICSYIEQARRDLVRS